VNRPASAIKRKENGKMNGVIIKGNEDDTFFWLTGECYSFGKILQSME